MQIQNYLSKEEARKVFQLTKEFIEIKPWLWLKDTDLFGVKLEDMEEIIYCSVLGQNDKVKGMAFYIGVDGIESYFRILKGRYDLQAEKIHIENSLVLYLDDKKDLLEEDHNLIGYSGVDFHGDKEWPNFRKYEPGYVPRSLKDEELLLITRVLEVAKDIIYQLKDQQNDGVVREKEECYIVESKKNGSYEKTFLGYEGLLQENKKIQYSLPNYDELELQRIKKNCIRTAEIWEIDTFNYSISVDDEGSPYFPAVLLIVDTESQRIIGNHATHPCRTASEWQKYILGWIQEKEILPRKVVLSNRKLLTDIKGMIDKLGVKIEVMDRLDYIPDIKKKYFSKII